MKATIIVKNMALALLGTVTIGILLSIGRHYDNTLMDVHFMNIIAFLLWDIFVLFKTLQELNHLKK